MKHLWIVAVAAIYLGFSHSISHITPFHWAFVVFVSGLYVAHPKTRQFIKDAAPLFGFLVLYDFFPIIPQSWWGIVLIEQPYHWEQSLFGFQPAAWFQAHHFWLLDLMGAFFYFLHFVSFLFFALFLWWRSPTHFKRFGWAFFLTNAAWMLTVLWIPTAAPWVVAQHGFAPPLLNLTGDAAGLLRFDQLVGRPFFENIYRSSHIVFGAFPSMHAAWPVLMLFGIRGLALKKLAVAITLYGLGMAFSAVYLGHHYGVDLIAGWSYAVAFYFLTAIKIT